MSQSSESDSINESLDVMQNNEKTWLCQSHANQFIAFCNDCQVELCLDCIFEHQKFQTHQIQKLEILRVQWANYFQKLLQQLNQYTFEIKQNWEQASIDINKIIDQGQAQIQKCEEEIINLVRSHFDKFQREFQDTINQRMEEVFELRVYKALIQKSDQISETMSDLQNPTFDVSQLIQIFYQDSFVYDIEKLKKRLTFPHQSTRYFDKIDRKGTFRGETEEERKSNSFCTLYPQIAFSSTNLRRFSQSLSQILGFEFCDQAQEMPAITLRQNNSNSSASLRSQIQNLVLNESTKRISTQNGQTNLNTEDNLNMSLYSRKPILPWFIEGTNRVLLYNVSEQSVKMRNLTNSAYSFPFQHVVSLRNSDEIYLIGGENSAGKCVGDFMYYNIEKNEIKPVKSMIKGRIGHAAVYDSFRDCLYVIGGKSTQTRLDNLEAFSYQKEIWEVKKSMPMSRSGISACGNQKYLYVFGGLGSNDEIVQNVIRYEKQTDNWKILDVSNISTFFPQIRSTAFFVDEKQIVIFGGCQPHQNNSLILNSYQYIFNVERNLFVYDSNLTENQPHIPLLGTGVHVFHKDDILFLPELMKENKSFGPNSRIILRFNKMKFQWNFDPITPLHQIQSNK